MGLDGVKCYFSLVVRPVGRGRMVYFVVFCRVFCIYIWFLVLALLLAFTLVSEVLYITIMVLELGLVVIASLLLVLDV